MAEVTPGPASPVAEQTPSPFACTVIIPVYNGARYLAPAIESVLGQSLRPAEILVVDDGSTDDSAAVAGRYAPAVHCLIQPHQGAANARNYGIAQAAYEFLAFLDADDLWAPGKLACQAAVFQADPAVEAVLGRAENFVSPDLPAERKAALAPSAAGAGTRHVGLLLVRRAAFDRLGPFDVRWRQGEFIEWWARAEDAGLRQVTLPELLLYRRLHDTNLTRTERDQRGNYVHMLQQVIARRRTAAGAGE